MTIAEIINAQMEAFDNRDIENMMPLFSDDIKFHNFADHNTIINGLADCKKMYTDLFNHSPKLRAEIISTIAFANKVIVHEFIYGKNGSDEKMEQVIIFEVNDGKINALTIMR